jgi:curved DNA-binding protein CbpA
MSNAHIDYYAILKVPQQATPEEIKKSYRELARRYHPDVNHGADAAQQIKAVNEAYHILGDVDRRATYDAHRLLNAETMRATSTSNASRAETREATQRPTPKSTTSSGSHGAPYGFNGFGRVRNTNNASNRNENAWNEGVRNENARAREQRSRPTPAPKPPPQASRPNFAQRAERATTESQTADSAPWRGGRDARANIGQTVQSLVADAQMAYVMRRYTEAERLCRQVLMLDRRQPVVHEMLGDIYARRGDTERATTAYAYAIQFNPRNQSAQMKLERLAGAEVSHRGPTMTRAVQTPPLERILNGPNRDRFIGATSLALVATLVGAILFIAFYPGYNGALTLGALSVNLLVSLMVSGLATGMLLAFYGGMRPVSQELALRTNARSPVHLSTLLGFSAVIWFYASLVIYLFVSVSRSRPSFSVLRAYGVSFLLSVAFACLYNSATNPLCALEAMAFGGNLLFPTVLAGWRLGDRLRLSGT